MLRTIFAVIAATLIIHTDAKAADCQFTFEQFPAEIYTGAPAPLQWDNEVLHEDIAFKGGTYEHLLTATERRFGGHYVVALYTLGTGLMYAFIVDITTGRFAADLPDGAEFVYRSDSKLLVVNPATIQALSKRQYYPKEEQFESCYKWDGGKFSLLGKKAWPD